MSSAGGEGGGMNIPLVIGGGLIVIWMLAHGSGNEKGIFGQNFASSTENTASSSIFEYHPTANTFHIAGEDDGVTSQMTPYEIENGIADAKQEVDKLKEQARVAKLWGVVSPYRDHISLSAAHVWDDDEDTEYLLLSVYGDDPIDVSGWRIESMVTGNSARIGYGTRLARSSRSDAGHILIEPGENAYLITGESPLGTSFHENKCIGYLSQYQTFTPSLPMECPSPLDEMREFSDIHLDNDKCYEAVQTIPSCRVVNEDRYGRISSACKNFIDDTLTYGGCVDNHKTDPFFYSGAWHIYLEENDELWRSEREIIRLRDAQDRTVAVLEY